MSMRRRNDRRGRGLSQRRLLHAIRQVVAQYPNAPVDIGEYTWLRAPRYWDRLTLPGGAEIEPRHQDQHAGVAFRVGWSEPDRAVGLWML